MREIERKNVKFAISMFLSLAVLKEYNERYDHLNEDLWTPLLTTEDSVWTITELQV